MFTKVVFGLGNPGSEYVYSRHNIGFQCLIMLMDRLKLDILHIPEGDYAKLKWVNSEHYLVKPMTFMNRSGQIIDKMLNLIDFKVEETLTIVDDIQIPFGEIRIKKSGSSGGHNGLKSMEDAFNTMDFPRMRIGIGRPGDDDVLSDYVLDPWSETEITKIKSILPVIGDIIIFCFMNPIEKAIAFFNGFNPAEFVETSLYPKGD
ncbi:MAG: aminoacyl-tRNA hydrolase [Candidatus Coatesbacteria bacterium]|nr:aminoacyl-tRNA hydrolase [Candidatus Coatesbacteria bacterium]